MRRVCTIARGSTKQGQPSEIDNSGGCLYSTSTAWRGSQIQMSRPTVADDVIMGFIYFTTAKRRCYPTGRQSKAS
jgi:hypothetical protein